MDAHLKAPGCARIELRKRFRVRPSARSRPRCGGDLFVSADASVDAPALDGGPVGDGAGLVACDVGAPPNAMDLTLWYTGESAQVSNGQVTQWSDRSPSMAHLAPPGPMNAPQFVGTAINGLPAVHFSANQPWQLQRQNGNTPAPGAGDYLVAIVARFSNDPMAGNQGIAALFWTGSLSSCDGLTLTGNVMAASCMMSYSAGVQSLIDSTHMPAAMGAYNDGAFRIYATRRVSGTAQVRVNGQVVATSNNATANLSGQWLRVGSIYDGRGFPLEGDIAEIVAVYGMAAHTMTSPVETYLRCKYGL